LKIEYLICEKKLVYFSGFDFPGGIGEVFLFQANACSGPALSSV